MATRREYALANANVALLREELEVQIAPADIRNVGHNGTILWVIHADTLSAGELLFIDNTVAAHNPALLSTLQQEQADAIAASANVVARFDASNFADKSPDEIFTFMQTAIDGWANLGDAQADMRKWFPLMAALIIHLRSE